MPYIAHIAADQNHILARHTFRSSVYLRRTLLFYRRFLHSFGFSEDFWNLKGVILEKPQHDGLAMLSRPQVGRFYDL